MELFYACVALVVDKLIEIYLKNVVAVYNRRLGFVGIASAGGIASAARTVAVVFTPCIKRILRVGVGAVRGKPPGAFYEEKQHEI